MCPLAIHIKVWTVSSDVSIQRRHWQPLLVRSWAYCTQPNPWWDSLWKLTTPAGSASPTLFEQCCGFFYFPQEPGKCKCCETWPTAVFLLTFPTRYNSLINYICCYCFDHVSLSYLQECKDGKRQLIATGCIDRAFRDRGEKLCLQGI